MRCGSGCWGGVASAELRWWETGRFVLLVSLASALPLLWPAIPPLVDVPGHMGRYAVQLGMAGPRAADWYDFDWALIGNLGVDLLVQLLAPVIGLELSVKLIVAAIPPLQVAGFLLCAREVHGRVPPAALFAAPLAYAYPFHFGFINFALAAALAFLAFALWVRMGRQGRLRQRALVFVPLSLLLWLVHTFGIGLLGVLAFGAEVARLHGRGETALRLPFAAAAHCLVLAPPLVLMLLTRSDAGGMVASDWFNWSRKLDWIEMVLRDRWEMFDLASSYLLALPLIVALVLRGFRWSGAFLLAAAMFALLFALMPRILFGSAYADMRLAPFAIAAAILAVGPARERGRGIAPAIAISALLFFTVRTGGTAASLGIAQERQQAALRALDHIPEGTRLIAFVGKDCGLRWSRHRLDHLPSLALVRRHAFANDQWDMTGSQLIRVRYLAGSGWTNDPSQLVSAVPCNPDWRPIAQAVRDFPRDAFDYVWIVAPPPGARYDETGIVPVWRNGSDVVYRVERTMSTASR
jgi:hypothetical protein